MMYKKQAKVILQEACKTPTEKEALNLILTNLDTVQYKLGKEQQKVRGLRTKVAYYKENGSCIEDVWKIKDYDRVRNECVSLMKEKRKLEKTINKLNVDIQYFKNLKGVK